MAEIRGVLAGHGKLDRFALHLAHLHFVLEPDEVLIERPDPDGRTQHVTVGKRAGGERPTTWMFGNGPSTQICCVRGTSQVYGGGCIGHVGSASPGKDPNALGAATQREKKRAEHGPPIAGHDAVREQEERER